MPDGLVVPDGWTRTTLGALGQYLNGRAFKSTEWTKTGRPIIRIQDLTGSNRNPNYFEGEVAERYVVRPGDFLISWSATLGAYIWEGPEGVLNQHIFKVKSNINKKFHYHLVRERIAELERKAHGSGMVHVTKGIFDDTPVAVPIEELEQEKIASTIDSVESKQRSAAEHLVSARRSIKRLRQAVLAAACSGRLTRDWRDENTSREPAAETVARIDSRRRAKLGKRHRDYGGFRADPELPDGWCSVPVGLLLDVATGATPLRGRADYYGGDIPWVTSGAVNAGLITKPTEYITARALRETNVKVFPAGTLLVAMYGEGQTRGRVAELGIEATTNQAVAALLFNEDSAALKPYLRLFFLQNYERIRALSFGGVQPNLSLGVIRETPVLLPPVDEQVEIVSRVAQLMSTADRFDSRISAASRRIERNSQAVLAKAFRGGLSSNGIAGGVVEGSTEVVAEPE